MISITSPLSSSSGKIDVITHMGCSSGMVSSRLWLGAFQVLLRRNSKDLLDVSYMLLQRIVFLLMLFGLHKCLELCLPHINEVFVYYFGPSVGKVDVAIGWA